MFLKEILISTFVIIYSKIEVSLKDTSVSSQQFENKLSFHFIWIKCQIAWIFAFLTF